MFHYSYLFCGSCCEACCPGVMEWVGTNGCMLKFMVWDLGIAETLFGATGFSDWKRKSSSNGDWLTVLLLVSAALSQLVDLESAGKGNLTADPPCNLDGSMDSRNTPLEDFEWEMESSLKSITVLLPLEFVDSFVFVCFGGSIIIFEDELTV